MAVRNRHGGVGLTDPYQSTFEIIALRSVTACPGYGLVPVENLRKLLAKSSMGHRLGSCRVVFTLMNRWMGKVVRNCLIFPRPYGFWAEEGGRP